MIRFTWSGGTADRHRGTATQSHPRRSIRRLVVKLTVYAPHKCHDVGIIGEAESSQQR